jgi:hypothetical protein
VATLSNLGRRRWGGVLTYVQRPTGYSARLAGPSPRGGISGVTDGRLGGWHFFAQGVGGPTLAVRKRPASHGLTMFGEKAIVAGLITRSDLFAAIG